MVIQAKMSQEHGPRKKKSRGVCLVLALDIKTDVSAAGFKDGNIAAHVAAGDHPGATDESRGDVGQDTASQVSQML